MANETLISGLVIRAQSGFFTVHTAEGDIVCQIRGRLKQTRQATDLLALGDTVQISRLPNETGMIEKIDKRRNALTRKATTDRGARNQRYQARSAQGQVLVANIDRAFFVLACANPAPHLRFLDRLLVIAERDQIPVTICLNKVDLVECEQVEQWMKPYRKIGYDYLLVSAKSGEGVETLRQALHQGISVFTGPSGVGKSSLLNALFPELGLAVSAVSSATTKGRHTTVYPELVPLPGGGWLADTPGIRTIGLHDIEPYEVDAYFREIAPLVADCEFSDCTHLKESGCAVKKSVKHGMIDINRYESYCRIRNGEMDNY
jgi:ribosome biogenesis GTPase